MASPFKVQEKRIDRPISDTAGELHRIDGSPAAAKRRSINDATQSGHRLAVLELSSTTLCGPSQREQQQEMHRFAVPLEHQHSEQVPEVQYRRPQEQRPGSFRSHRSSRPRNRCRSYCRCGNCCGNLDDAHTDGVGGQLPLTILSMRKPPSPTTFH